MNDSETGAGLIAGIATVAGFFGRFNWALDLAAHFRVQYALFFCVLAICFAIGKKRRAAGGALLFVLINLVPVAMFLLPPARANSEVGTPLRAMLINVNTHLAIAHLPQSARWGCLSAMAQRIASPLSHRSTTPCLSSS